MNPLDEIRSIEDSVLNLIDIVTNFINQGGELDENIQRELAQMFNEASERLQELYQQPPIPPQAPQGVDLLWILSGGDPQAFARYMQSVPDPAINQLAQNPDAIRDLVNRFNRELPQAAPSIQQGVESAPMQSSNIWGFSYDPQNASLKVRFQGDGVYEYQGVPAFVFKLFQQGAVAAKTEGQNQYGKWWIGKMPSLGAAFYELIRNGGYPYSKVA